MVRRSDHCLPSDSDKFTIKLHSLPSKFPSSALLRALLPLRARSLVGPSPCHPRAPPSAPQKLLPLCGHVGAPSEEPVLYSSAITITLCTPAPPFRGSLPVSPPAPFALFRPCSGLLVLRAATFRLSSSPSVPSSLCLVSSLRFVSLSYPSCLPIVLSHRPRLFRNCFRPFLLLLRLQLAGGLRMPSVTARALLESLFLFVFCILYSPSPRCLVQLSWYLFLDPSHLLPGFLLFSLCFLLFAEIGAEIS